MNDHQLSTASRGQNHLIGRFPPGPDRGTSNDDVSTIGKTSMNPLQQLNGKPAVNSLGSNGTSGGWNIWGTPKPIGNNYTSGTVDRRTGGAVGSGYEQPQGSAALLASADYDTWAPTKPGLGRPTESSSPGLPNVSINNSPSPQAIRSSVGLSTSPYLTQAAIGPIANGVGLSSLDKQNADYTSLGLGDFTNTNNRPVGDETMATTYVQNSAAEKNATPPQSFSSFAVSKSTNASPRRVDYGNGLSSYGFPLNDASVRNQFESAGTGKSLPFPSIPSNANAFLNEYSAGSVVQQPTTLHPHHQRPRSEQIYPSQLDFYAAGMGGQGSLYDPSGSFAQQAYYGNGAFGPGGRSRQQSGYTSPHSTGFPPQYEDPRQFPRPQSMNFGNARPPSYSGAGGYDYGRAVPMSPQYPMTPMSPVGMPNGYGTPRAQRQSEDYTHNLRSSLLEEFRVSNKTNKKYELKDIYNHVVEFSGDQHGSRFIQNKLETANSDEKETVFKEILPNALQLMTDVFGNYVIQKFFEHGNQVQKTKLADTMKNHVLTLSRQMYGCRVVQKALEHILTDQQAALVKELDTHVLACVRDQNGNHVIQKAIERVPAEHIQFIIKAFEGQVQSLATHPYGCRVIQRMLEHCEDDARNGLLSELHKCTLTLVQDQYGNYVTQHVIEHGAPEDKAKIIQLVLDHLLQFSKHKFASNVVEKSIMFGDEEQRQAIVDNICAKPEGGSQPLQILMRDQYGNYVIQKLLMHLDGRPKQTLVDQIKPCLQQLKKYAFAKHINAIEKLIAQHQPSTPRTTSASESSIASPSAQTPNSPTAVSDADTTTTAASVKEVADQAKVNEDSAKTPTSSA